MENLKQMRKYLFVQLKFDKLKKDDMWIGFFFLRHNFGENFFKNKKKTIYSGEMHIPVTGKWLSSTSARPLRTMAMPTREMAGSKPHWMPKRLSFYANFFMQINYKFQWTFRPCANSSLSLRRHQRKQPTIFSSSIHQNREQPSLGFQ